MMIKIAPARTIRNGVGGAPDGGKLASMPV